MKAQARLLLLGALGVSTSCRHAEIPYDLARVRARDKPIHAIRVAVVPFRDERSRAEGPDSADGFLYNGVELEHTDLSRLRRDAGIALARIVGRHLAKSRLFAQVILVHRVEDAPEADLVLTGSVKRARGYVEAKQRDPKGPRPNKRMVLAELVLADVSLRETKGARRTFLRADVGWSILEERPEHLEPKPWDLLGEVFFVAVDQLERLIATADLSGTFEVRDRVRMDAKLTATATHAAGALSATPPYGWRFVSGESRQPEGWASTSSCASARFEARQTQRFHRVLGPYVPTVDLWACPPDAHL